MTLRNSIIALCVLLIASCSDGDETIVPKPRGFLRITFPTKIYTEKITTCGYKFDLPTYATVQNSTQNNTNPCWKDIQFPSFKATLHLSYFELNNDLTKYINDARTLAYRHTVKAEYINEDFFKNEQNKTYAVVYDIGGNAASNYQFFITDSTQHFVRGALYYNLVPNADSLAPVNEFIKADIQRMIETFKWE
jgi:gliding motility-associated lipoprotein GldD